MYKGLEHTAIASADPEALAAWYEKYLGFPICHRYGGNIFVKAPDGTMLEIIPGDGDRPAPSILERHLGQLRKEPLERLAHACRVKQPHAVIMGSRHDHSLLCVARSGDRAGGASSAGICLV